MSAGKAVSRDCYEPLRAPPGDPAIQRPPGGDSVDPRQSPPGRHNTYRLVGKLRRFGHGRQVENVPPVGIAIAAIRIPVIGIGIGLVRPKGPRVIERHIGTDAMRPGVVAADGYTFRSPALYRKQQAVIFLNASEIPHRDVSDLPSFSRPLKT